MTWLLWGYTLLWLWRAWDHHHAIQWRRDVGPWAWPRNLWSEAFWAAVGLSYCALALILLGTILPQGLDSYRLSRGWSENSNAFFWFLAGGGYSLLAAVLCAVGAAKRDSYRKGWQDGQASARREAAEQETQR